MFTSSPTGGPQPPEPGGAAGPQAPRLPWVPPTPPPKQGLPWVVWLPFLIMITAVVVLLLALGPAFGNPRMAPARPQPVLDTSGPKSLTWSDAANGSATGRLHVRPGFAMTSGQLHTPGGQEAADLDLAMADSVAAAAQEPAPLTQFGLAEIAPVTALDHNLTLEPTLIDRNGMLATWGTRPLTSDADFRTPLIEGELDVGTTLRDLTADLSAGTPLLDEVRRFEPSRQWAPPDVPTLPDMPDRTQVAPPPDLTMPSLGAPAAPDGNRYARMSDAEFNALWQAARQRPNSPLPPIGSLTDAEYQAMLQQANRPATALDTWLALQGELGGLKNEYNQRAANESYQPLPEDRAATKEVFCNLVGANAVINSPAGRLLGITNACD